ncbi:MAG: ligand-binding protein SH3 [Candidatus Zambryskibacteria bacterium CG11_big_fil_rev_8_21_14_0_20_42_18]|nr:MAG: ligand-binding protein SH3 [Candidatus Zambryskibacteria bacterium CG11_big_fil_rev_8_21_14_0_20_42_18]
MFLETLYILIISASPLVELRGAIPVAVAVYNFSPWLAYFISVAGNMIPPLLLIPFLGKIDAFLSIRFEWWRRVFAYFLEKTRNNHSRKFELFKEFALVILVAIPLPFTGAWTASLVAHIFGIPFRKAIPLILLGVLIAGAIVLAATLGLITFLAL